ncbi:hypothetical protein EDB86DRAFT_3105615 [Lactarius hatsudake]|nr:hypothetical protein EDB86DRAFT_3105615 [Lactarius hatsudake]
MGDESRLHITVFDELDAVFKQRGSTDSATVTGIGDTVVNQLLSKMGSVHQLNNYLVIGVTNRIDMIDKALPRPGRFEVQHAVGVEEEELAQVVQNGIIRYEAVVDELLRSGKFCVEQVRTSTRTPLVSLLLHGPPGTGKTALAATIAQASMFPFIRLITPDNMVGFSEAQKVQAISKVFADSSKGSMSVVIVDDIGHLLVLLQYGTADPHCTHGKRPPKGHRLVIAIIATTSLYPTLTDLGLTSFDAELYEAPLTDLTTLDRVLEAVEIFRSTRDRAHAMGMLRQAGLGLTEEGRLSIGIKRLPSVIKTARQDPEAVAKPLMSSLMGVGM